MENQLVWKDEFNIGVKIIDEEHQRLFKLINRLFSLVREEHKSARACQEGIKYFKAHAVKHFEDEETYMELIGYEDLETHRRVHKNFREDTLPALERELENSDYSHEAVIHFLAVCAGWLIGHTLTEDRAITGGKVGKWEDLLPEEELEAIRQVISRLLHDMFQLKAHVISESYDGEKFGNGIYYRVVYGREQDEGKWEIFLIFEDKLLVNTVGKIMGIRSGKLDVMLMSACRYTASQFVWRVMQHFPALSTYEMQEENFLTYDQFQKAFETKKPQVSLLFNTSGGYFAYCVIAPHLFQHSIGTPLEVENEMSEIEKYLTGRDGSQKPKVLVVDDSMTIRQGMKSLLEGEYDVAAVGSGVSAIRAITLDPPDLILLDYEMPVCDGVHVLEMLHSEDEFADIPVIFLTSKDDPDIVRKVLALKPEGYLLKYLKPVELRKRIQDYFKKAQT
ncbi:MAG: bacteriohemerythrin [Lachnospiraceae bacterium]|nr:bacteriohemerythrin [Lachnospiraceae bacterium]